MAQERGDQHEQRESKSVRKGQGLGCGIILLIILPIAFFMWGPYGFVGALFLFIIIGVILYYSFLRERGRSPEPDDEISTEDPDDEEPPGGRIT